MTHLITCHVCFSRRQSFDRRRTRERGACHDVRRPPLPTTTAPPRPVSRASAGRGPGAVGRGGLRRGARGLAVTGHRRHEPVDHATHQVLRGRHVHVGPALPVAVGPAAERAAERVRGRGGRRVAGRLHVPARRRSRKPGTTR